ncbi:MAG: PotD/PotF family extracellular solute-binding protein [Chloroflexota bacterium]
MIRNLRAALILLLLGAVCSACGAPEKPAQPPTSLIFYNWEGDLPQSVIDAYQAESGVQIIYKVYEAQEDALAELREGEAYDVVVMDSRFVPQLAAENLLAQLDYSRLPNYKNISPAFRDLLYDPGNVYSLPYNWGVTGLLVRTDHITQTISSWNALWEPMFIDRVGIWQGQPREMTAMVLKALGYSANAEDPQQLAAARQKLLALKPAVHFFEDYDLETAAEAFASGKVDLGVGYASDYLACIEAGLPVAYIFPDEGALLWGDTFVIPAASRRQAQAADFLNFLMRPEISAQITNQNNFPTANVMATPLINPQLVSNPVIFPPKEVIQAAEVILPLSAAAQAQYDAIWQEFLEAP